jgi:hypothetical protein
MSSVKTITERVPIARAEPDDAGSSKSQQPLPPRQESLHPSAEQRERYKNAKKTESKFTESAARSRPDLKHETNKAGKKPIIEEAKLVRTLRKPSPEQLKEIHNAIQAGDKDKAINLAIKYYNIDTSAAKSIQYDKNIRHPGNHNPNTDEIKVGTSAFWAKGKISPEKLAAVIYHETIHARHSKDPNQQVGTTKQGQWADHLEVWDKTIQAARNAGMGKDVIDEMELYRRDHYYGLTPENRKKVDKGDYNSIQ